MADADEDRIPSSTQLTRPINPNDVDNESDSDGDSDAAPDYRFLPSTTTSSRKHALPARGTKDFEPNATSRQSSTLQTSRKAMTDALSVLRVHNSKKGEMVGVYFANEEDWDGKSFDKIQEQGMDGEARIKFRKSTALNEGEGRCVAVERFTNTYVRTMGKSDRRNWIWLLPEEALFLIERGTLDIRYEVQEGEDEDMDSDEDENDSTSGTTPELGREQDEGDAARFAASAKPDQATLTLSNSQSEQTLTTVVEASVELQPQLNISRIPMSLQGAYAAFIGKGGLTLERYVVYANLRRGGYIVQRAPSWSGPITTAEEINANSLTQVTAASISTTPSQPISLISRLLSYLFKTPPKPSSVPCHNSIIGPLISPGLFRNYYDIYRQLQLIPQYSYTQPQIVSPTSDSSTANLTDPVSPPTEEPLLPTYYLHKPSAMTTYKKTSPPPPHYRVVVLSSRETSIPTSTQIGDLLASQPDDILPNAEKKKLETKVKHGRRNVLIAVVDNGLVSYMRFSGGGFEESLWGENERRGATRGGGKGGGRGRGGNRGRGGRGGGSGTRGRGG